MSVGRDTSFNLAAAVTPVLFALIVTPFYLHFIGPDRFGILAICWTILGAATLTSLGMGPALAYGLALMDEEASTARSNQVWMALVISLAASLAAALLLLVIARAYFPQFVSLPSGLKAELWNALPFLAALLPLSTVSGVLNGALQGRKRFGALSAMTVLTAAAAAVIPLLAAMLFSVELLALSLALVSAISLVLSLQLAICARAVPLHFPSRLGSEQLRGLIGYGAWMSITALIAPFLLLFDRFVVGSLRGPTAVTVYVLAFYMLQGLLLVPASLSRAMLPRLASSRSEEEVQELQSSWLLWLSGLLTPLSIVAICLAAPFFHFWIGPPLGKVAAPVAAILLVGGWLHGIAHIPSTVVVGRSRPDRLTKLLLACLLPYLLLLYFATAQFGVMGAAAAWTIRAAFDPVLFLYTRPAARDLWRVAASGILVLAAMGIVLALTWTGAAYWGSMTFLLVVASYENREVLISLLGEFRKISSKAIRNLAWLVLPLSSVRLVGLGRGGLVTDTSTAEYSKRFRSQTVWWKVLLDVQAPYRWNLRRLMPGYTLDVGCGIGRNLVNLKGIGIDHNVSNIAKARELGLEAYTPGDFKGGSFDSLLFAHVLEHCADPAAVIRQYLPYLKSGGQLILITPQERGFYGVNDNSHVSFLDLDALSTIAISLGFKIKRAYSFPFPRFMGKLFTYNEFVLVAVKDGGGDTGGEIGSSVRR
jgi:O-antigen/teichoic acid export membrane protein